MTFSVISPYYLPSYSFIPRSEQGKGVFKIQTEGHNERDRVVDYFVAVNTPAT